MGSERRLLGKLQDRELGVTRQLQQLLENDGLCPGGSGELRGWGLSQAITSITLPLCRGHRAVPASWASPVLGAGGAGAWETLAWAQWGHEAHWDCPKQPPALRRARCELRLSFVGSPQSPAVVHCPGGKMERPFTCH